MGVKRVLVTGGSGLVGRHLRAIMPDATYVSSKDFNLLDPGAAARLVWKGWDRIVHLAARVGGLADNMAHQADYFEENMSMGMNVLGLAREAGVPRLTVVASTCAYPDVNSVYPMPEEDLQAGPPPPSNAGYAHAKRAIVTFAELVDSEVRPSGGAWNWVAPCNLYGPGDKGGDRGHFVTALLEKIHEAQRTGRKRIPLMGTGAPLRQFMHAGDLARVLKTVCELDVTESFNCCPPSVLSVKEIAETALLATGIAGISLEFDPSKPDGQFRKDASSWRMMHIPQLSGFKFTPLIEGMRQTYEHMQREWELSAK